MQSMPEPVWVPPEDMGDQLYLFWASNIIFVDIFYCILESPRPSIPCSPRSFLTWPNSNTTWKPAHILAFVPPTHCILSYWKGFFGVSQRKHIPEGVRRCKRQDRGRVPKNGKRTCDFVVVVAASDSAPCWQDRRGNGSPVPTGKLDLQDHGRQAGTGIFCWAEERNLSGSAESSF